ncbi:hypothetical protein LCGC14_2881710 [marine sediment metagenome]|uniref:Uncharacterized protein n=1 Tax=marine sediment metagenome TaxID=412755 RepID=A0A0F9A7V9_9ZZZZ|nr:hypothetical protein [Porticoccus sp.]
MAIKIRMFVDNWSYNDFNTFLEAVTSGDITVQYEMADKLLIGWDYETPFEEGIMGLSVADGAEVLRTILETLQTVAEDLDIDDVTVDFSKWNTKRFLEFQTVRGAANHRKVERMLREVTSVEGLLADEELSFQDGAKMMKALTETYKRLITGKN